MLTLSRIVRGNLRPGLKFKKTGGLMAEFLGVNLSYVIKSVGFSFDDPLTSPACGAELWSPPPEKPE